MLIAAQDASFIPKSGKLTHVLDYFWNGCAAKAEKGLEINVIAAIKVTGTKKEGYPISSEQTPADSMPVSQLSMLPNFKTLSYKKNFMYNMPFQ